MFFYIPCCLHFFSKPFSLRGSEGFAPCALRMEEGSSEEEFPSKAKLGRRAESSHAREWARDRREAVVSFHADENVLVISGCL